MYKRKLSIKMKYTINKDSTNHQESNSGEIFNQQYIIMGWKILHTHLYYGMKKDGIIGIPFLYYRMKNDDIIGIFLGCNGLDQV